MPVKRPLVDRQSVTMYSIGMKPLVLAKTIKAIDLKAQTEAHIPALSLMESAGFQVYLTLKPYLEKEMPLLFLCGSANNGGDALVVARYAFNDGFTNQQVITVGERQSEAFSAQQAIAKAYHIPFLRLEETSEAELASHIQRAGWIIDGLFGTGVHGTLKSDVVLLLSLVNESTAKRLAVDVPSGIGDEMACSQMACKADITVTMGCSKRAMFHPATHSYCGKIQVINPSFPPSLLENVPVSALLCEQELPHLRKLDSSEYKNSRGHVAIFAGSKAYSGAARLAARSCFFSRAGLVSLYCDQEIYAAMASEAPSVMVKPYQKDKLECYDALLAGPGWGSSRTEILSELFSSKLPLVLDADAIHAYASILQSAERPEHGALIMTPHLGELRAISSSLGVQQPETLGRTDTPTHFFSTLEYLAGELDATLIVKSSLVHIASPGKRVIVVEGNNPSLGVAGSGDVLAGLVAALFAKTKDPDTAALQGALLHQQAGKNAHLRYGYYDSETLIQFVGEAVREAEE